jgi:hypothetical protein
VEPPLIPAMVLIPVVSLIVFTVTVCVGIIIWRRRRRPEQIPHAQSECFRDANTANATRNLLISDQREPSHTSNIYETLRHHSPNVNQGTFFASATTFIGQCFRLCTARDDELSCLEQLEHHEIKSRFGP